MKSPSLKSTRVLVGIATPLALLGAAGMVYQASSAAFTGQTRNSGNEWSTGAVNLTDDDNGQSRFQVANMLPGDTETKCITVTATSSVPSTVKGYTINPVSSVAGLENRIMVSIKSGTGGTFADCAGFVATDDVVTGVPLSALAANDTYEEALGGWTVPVGTHERTYQFTWRFDTDGMTQAQVDQLQGAKTGIDMQWEMRTAE